MPAPAASVSSFGALLQYWRKTRNLSQLALAHEADVSPRHVCFVETGRARPSRDMVVLLSTVLDVPLRERNALLLAAGFAPVYGEARLDAPVLGIVRAALTAILRQQEPFPAVVMNRHWDILDSNRAAQRFFGMLLDGRPPPGAPNVLRLMFDPAAVRASVENWEDVAESLIRRVHREAVGGAPDAQTRRLLEELLAYPGVPRRLRRLDLTTPLVPVVPVRFAKDGERFDYFSTVTTLGTPLDVTLQEVRIECFHPADEPTRAAAERLSRDAA
jgi:transcriptional regulator with XRE-family HTH domain